MPLAISALLSRPRRGHSRTLRFVCEKDRWARRRNARPQLFVAVNGVQTLSYTCANLIGDLADLSAIGVGACRLSSQSCDMVAVAQTFRDVLDGRLDYEEGQAAVSAIFPQAPASNGFLHGQPGAELIGRSMPGKPLQAWQSNAHRGTRDEPFAGQRLSKQLTVAIPSPRKSPMSWRPWAEILWPTQRECRTSAHAC